jgi:hypothetical protein
VRLSAAASRHREQMATKRRQPAMGGHSRVELIRHGC